MWPTSLTWKLTRNGVLPSVAAIISGGLWGGYLSLGLCLSPAQRVDSGSRCARFRVCSTGRRTFAQALPGSVPSQASMAFSASRRALKPALRMSVAMCWAYSLARASSLSITTMLPV